MVKIKIDGKSVQAKEGSTILQNIRDLRIDMPTLCYHEELIPFGACRLCTVEVKTNGKGQLTTACDCQVAAGMDITTASDKAVESRKLAAELLYYKYPTTRVVREIVQKLVSPSPRQRLKVMTASSAGSVPEPAKISWGSAP